MSAKERNGAPTLLRKDTFQRMIEVEKKNKVCKIELSYVSAETNPS